MKPAASPASSTRPTPGTTSPAARTHRAAARLALHRLAERVAPRERLEHLLVLLVRPLRLRVEHRADDRHVALGHDVAVAEAVADVAHVDAVEVGLELAVDAAEVLQRDVGRGAADAERAAHRRASAVGADQDVGGDGPPRRRCGPAATVTPSSVASNAAHGRRGDDGRRSAGSRESSQSSKPRRSTLRKRSSVGLLDVAVPVVIAEVHVARREDDLLGNLGRRSRGTPARTR